MTPPESNPDAPLRVGVIGAGWAGVTHVESFSAVPGVRVTALAAKETDRIAAIGRTHGIAHLFADWQDLVALDELDVVTVAAPNALHHPIVIAALRAGKHVLCEKPLALDAEQAREMVATARKVGRVLDVAFNHRRRADVQYVRRWIETHGIGRIYHARASWKRRSGIPGLDSWFTSKELAGGGALIDLGPHVVDAVFHLMGEPRATAVSAVAHGHLGRAGYGASTKDAQRSGAGFDVEDLASALIRLDDGASIALEISWAAHAADDEDISIELLGVEGGARVFVNRYRGEDTVRIYRSDGGVPVTIAPDVRVAGGEHKLVAADFVAAVRSGVWTAHHGDFALHRTEVIDACYRSAAEGREVTL